MDGITRGSLKKSLYEWMEWFGKFARDLIPRRDLPPFQKELCLAITGVRRSGKTSMAVQLAKELNQLETTFYFNFEDPLFFAGTNVTVIDSLVTLYQEEVGRSPTLIILDEVQGVLGWEKWVRKAIDTGKYQVIVTGSSSELLSSEIATAIGGRVLEAIVWPLSFEEFLDFRKVRPESEGIYLRELEEYLYWGGFPKVALLKSETDKILLLKQYISDIVLRDVMARHQILNQQALHQLVAWYVGGVACLHSYNAIRKAFGMSTELVSNLTHYLSQAFLAFEMSRYHPNLKVQSRDPKKVYFIDAGLRTVSLQSAREDWGRLAENLVYLELRRRKKELYYFKQEQEVDFVLTRLGKPTEALQVSYSDLTVSKTLDREVFALLECLKALKLKSGKILTHSYEDLYKTKGCQIEFIPLHQWLVKK
jgi:hypothetical protein